MKKAVLIFFFLIALCTIGFGQGAQAYFNNSATHYVHNRRADALRTVEEGIQKYPNDQKLKALADKLKEEKKKEDQKRNQENKEKQEKEQQQKDQQKKEQEQKEQKDQKDQQEKQDQKSQEEKKDQEAKDKKEGEQDNRENKDNKNEKTDKSPQLSQKLQQMKMSEEKAKMILEAMKNQEIQYLQQNKRKATKPRESGKPDW
jgi:lipopolysaccharide export LptBFGC system permease protein LptF